MKIGDLVLVNGSEVALVLSDPRMSEDCKPGGDAYPHEMYYLVTVLGQYGLEDWEEEDLEVINEAR